MKKLLIPAVIVALTVLTWHKVYDQSFMGEGFQYFTRSFFHNPEGIIASLLGYDTLARLLFDIFAQVFKDNLRLYMVFLLITVSLINVLYYFLVYALTEKKIVAFLAAVFFTVNYVTSYEMLALGNYQFFIQRVVGFIPVFVSFLLLVRFFKKGNILFYRLSVGLFWLSVLLAQFNIYLLPMFIFYAFFFWQEKTKNRQKFWPKFSLVIPFVLGTLILLFLDKMFGANLVYEKSTFEFGSSVQTLIRNTIYQIPWAVLLLRILRGKEEMALATPVIILFLSVLFYLLRRKTTFRPVLLTVAFFIPTSLLLNSYTRGPQVSQIYEGSRYLYVPAMASSIFLAIVLYFFFYQRKLVGKLLLLGFMGWWVFFNFRLIWTKMDEQQQAHLASKETLSFLKKESAYFANNALVVLPGVIGYYGSDFCQKFYGQGKVRFAPIFADWEKENGFDLNRVVVFDFDYDEMVVINRTKEFQELIKKGDEEKLLLAKMENKPK